MRLVKVTFSNGDTITTSINGTDEELKQYYAIGRYFNLGPAPDGSEDNMQKVTQLEILK